VFGSEFCNAFHLVEWQEAHDEGVSTSQCPIGGKGDHIDASALCYGFGGADVGGKNGSEDELGVGVYGRASSITGAVGCAFCVAGDEFKVVVSDLEERHLRGF